MRTVVQRVLNARVTVGGKTVGAIGPGLLVLVAVEEGDTLRDTLFMSRKLTGLRIFEDAEGKMNRPIADIGGQLLLISQFTLYGDCRKGSRPSFTRAAAPQLAEELYESLAEQIRQSGVKVETGRFRARMQVASVNDGPVTLIIDSRKMLY